MYKVQSFRINPDYALTNLVYINKKNNRLYSN